MLPLFVIRSFGKAYDLESELELYILKGDLKAGGFFDADGNGQYEEYFTRKIKDNELSLFINAVKFWDYNRLPKGTALAH